MSEIDTVMAPAATSGDQPSTPAQPSPVATQGDQPAAQPANNGAVNLDGMTQEQLEAIIAGEPIPQQVEAPAQEQPKEAQKPDSQDDDEDDANATNTQPDANKQPRVRINLNQLPKTEQDMIRQARDMVATGQAKSVKEAILKLDPEAAAPQAQEQPGETPQAEPKPAEEPPAVKALQDRIAELKAARDNARTQTFDMAEADRLSDEIADATAELKLARIEAKQSATESQTWAQQEAAQIEVVTATYPDLLDESSVFYEEFAQLRTVAEVSKDPVMSKPDWPVQLAEKTKAKLARLGVATTAKPAPQTQTLPQPPAKPARPPGQLGATGADRAPLTPQEINRAIANLTPEQLEAVLAAEDSAAALGIR